MKRGARLARLTVWRAEDGYRWRMVFGGHIVAESGEAYSERNKCIRAMCQVFGLTADAVYAAAESWRWTRTLSRPLRIRIEGPAVVPDETRLSWKPRVFTR